MKIIKLNRPDIEQKLKENGGYCPCSIVKDDNHKCMCKEFRDTTEGVCHCGLYEKKQGD